MKKIISLLLLTACIFSVAALGISAAYTPLTPEKMTEELSEKENGGMAFGWGFDDITTQTNEYVKDAYAEAAALAKLGKYTMTEKSADEVAQLGVSGLVCAAVLEKKTGGEAITLYKFSDNDAAAAYAALLVEKHSDSDPEIYVRACGTTVAEGDKDLVYRVGVTVVNGSVMNGDFVSSTTEGIESEFYQGFKDGAQSGMQFKNYDSAIVFRNGEIVYTQVGALLQAVSGVYDYNGLTLDGGTENIVIDDIEIPMLESVVLS